MRVFVTGATGFVGSAIVRELLDAGHPVVGLARSEENAKQLKAAGAEVHRGALEDMESLRSGVAAADAVIHCAFIHDFTNLGAAAAKDKTAIETLGAALGGSERPLIVTSGSLLVQPRGAFATEEDSDRPDFPRKSEDAARALAARGVRVSVVRLPPSVHGDGDHGFVPVLGKLARQKGASAYVGDGSNRWPAVHRRDAARLYRLILESGATRPAYHAIADEGVPFREIAEAIGRQVKVPVVSKSGEDVAMHFEWMAMFAGIDGPASSALTREWLGWKPSERGLIADIDRAGYFEAEAVTKR